jgi:hypothetical protein
MKFIQHFASSQASLVRMSKGQTFDRLVILLVGANSCEAIQSLPYENLLS